MNEKDKIQRSREAAKRWYHKHKEKARENAKKRYYQNREKKLEKNRKYNRTPMGRAHGLVRAYTQEDKKYNRGECDFDAKWVVDNIFSKPCVYCGITGWEVIGCNRLDNSKPHAIDNVEPCCGKCNVLLQMNNRDNLGRFIS